ncbi:MAG: ABC transporter permease [Pseudomonadota bacterium]
MTEARNDGSGGEAPELLDDGADAGNEVRRQTPVVSSMGLAGRALTFVVAAMCFLACLSFAIMMSAQRTSNSWASAVASEVTVQIRPLNRAEADAQTAAILELLDSVDGVDRARVQPPRELETMLSAWLGQDFNIDDLPVPRLIELRLDPENPPDLGQLERQLRGAVSTAVLDDHRFWVGRLRAGARSIVIAGGLLFVLVIAVMVATIIFATRGAMAGNREVIEVLHFVGAAESFIAGEFQRHFLILGLKAGVIGGVAALAMLLVTSAVLSSWIGTGRAEELRILVGEFSVDLVTLLGIAAIIALVAGLTMVTTRVTVFRYLHAIT